ncbi:MAG: hypothetical protein LBG45_05055 [Dysgonamonadaceae bacterium]|jgi:hypothetical protein|nr:hypothetical protein [Dysgonamonadaceae bacterium]
MIQSASQNIYLNVPSSEVGFLMTLAKKRGWKIETQADLIRKYIDSRPENVELSDEEIMEEVRAVRYSK